MDYMKYKKGDKIKVTLECGGLKPGDFADFIEYDEDFGSDSIYVEVNGARYWLPRYSYERIEMAEIPPFLAESPEETNEPKKKMEVSEDEIKEENEAWGSKNFIRCQTGEEADKEKIESLAEDYLQAQVFAHGIPIHNDCQNDIVKASFTLAEKFVKFRRERK